MTQQIRDPDLRPSRDIVESLESNVRYYSRVFPATFASSHGAEMFGTDGRKFIDFFCGAGALNYGHNNPRIRDRLITYLSENGILHALDMHTVAKTDFLLALHEIILEPRGLSFRIQSCGPTGTNAVEAALKLARLATNARFFRSRGEQAKRAVASPSRR